MISANSWKYQDLLTWVIYKNKRFYELFKSWQSCNLNVYIKKPCKVKLCITKFFPFFTNAKMLKDSSAKFYQNNKERLQKKVYKIYQRLLVGKI